MGLAKRNPKGNWREIAERERRSLSLSFFLSLSSPCVGVFIRRHVGPTDRFERFEQLVTYIYCMIKRREF
jgi:hypothetical protein